MEKFYTLILTVIMTFGALASKADCTVTINVDDSSRVAVKLNYVTVDSIRTGANKITVPQYGSLQIVATDGNYLCNTLQNRVILYSSGLL